MNESFVCYVWQYKLFELSTFQFDKFKVLSVGVQNNVAGPDFSNAKIAMDNQTWVGNVEIHYKSSDWNKHKHQFDPTYNNVILHVVYEKDCQVYDSKGRLVPTIEIKNQIPKTVLDNYKNLIANTNPILCSHHILNVEEVYIKSAIESALIKRLEEKVDEINIVRTQLKNNWLETFYHLMVSNYGFKYNNEAFKQLAIKVNYSSVLKARLNKKSIEALLFGSAGFLDFDPELQYELEIIKEFKFLQQKFKIQPIENHVWKFGGIRPVNSPHLRLAQLASVIPEFGQLEQLSKTISSVQDIKKLLRTSVNEYWNNHYYAGKLSEHNSGNISDASMNNLIINTIIPYKFVWAKHTESSKLQQNALDLLSDVKAESNSIVDKWKKLRIPVKSAFDSQGLLGLFRNSCVPKKCLNCTIGSRVIKS